MSRQSLKRRVRDFASELSTEELGTAILDLTNQLEMAGVGGHSLDAGQDAALQSLKARCSAGRFMAAALQGEKQTGAEAELQRHCGVGDRAIPFELFEPPRRRFRAKADTVTGAPSVVGVMMDSLVPSVFAGSVAPFLGIAMPRVAPGTHAVPRIETDLTAAMLARGTAAESTAGTFTIEQATPRRLSARLSLTLEDLASAGVPSFERSLRQNLRMVLSHALDLQLLRGDGSAPNISGVADQLTADTPQSAANTFANAASDLAGYLDGLYAVELGELRVIHNPAVYAHLASLFATNDDSVSHLDWCRRNDVQVVTSSSMSASASNVGKSIVVRAGTMAEGLEGAMAECPTWGAVSIDDRYSSSASATEHVTLHTLIGSKVVLRYPSAYAEWQVKTS